MKKSPNKNIIWKSFEAFVAQPLSLLCNKIVRIASIKSELLASGVNVDVTGDSIQVNVINSDGAYNLLAAVAYKKKMQALKRGAYVGSLTSDGAHTSPFGLQGAISTRKAIIENKKRTIFN